MIPYAAEPPVTPVTQECMVQVANQLQLPVLMLYGVLYQEAGTPGRISRNSNGTYDIGPMQINSIHLPFFKGSYGLTEAQLRNNGCLNVWAGGVLLWLHLQSAGGDHWKAVGNYHSKTKIHHDKYKYAVASKVQGWMDLAKRGMLGVSGAKPSKQVTATVESPVSAPAEPVVQPESQPAAVTYRRY